MIVRDDPVTTKRSAQRQGRPGNWSDIARDIPGRSGKSCRLRWCNQLDPTVKKEPFGDWEDAVIIRGWQVLAPDTPCLRSWLGCHMI